MQTKSMFEAARRQRFVSEKIEEVGVLHFFNLLTSPELMGVLEELMPEYRERKFPPTVALAMFLGQVLSEDGS